MPTPTAPTAILTASVPSDLLQRARNRAREEDKSTSAVVRAALTRYLADEEPGR